MCVVVVGFKTGGVDCCGCSRHDQAKVDVVTYSRRVNVKTVKSFVTVM